MKTKAVKDLQVGDLIKLTDPDGAAKITKNTINRIIDVANGVCHEIEWEVVEGAVGERGAALQSSKDFVEMAA